MSDDRPPGIGHNRGAALALIDALREDTATLARTRDDLIREAELVPRLVRNDEQCWRINDVIKKLAGALKSIEAKRVGAKEPHLQAGRTIDGFFHNLSAALVKQRKRLADSVEAYLRAKEDRERKAAERLRVVAQREADRANDPERRHALTKVADDAAARAEAKPAELTRVRGEFGSLASLRRDWDFEITDRAAIDLAALRPYLPGDAIERAVAAAVAAGVRELAGVRIFERRTAVIR